MHFLITAGGTREHIDPVRFISNASSGRMGYALARAALAAGHKVTLISAPTSLKSPKSANMLSVVSASDMYDAVRKHFPSCGCLIMAAAVSDYTPAKPSPKKLKKSATTMTLRLKPTIDILKWAGYHKRRQIVVGFALEDKDMLKRAEGKLKAKRSDMIIANATDAINAKVSSLAMKTSSSGWLFLGDSAKTASARKIVTFVEKLAAAHRGKSR
jgi:phosphopantothenoylcysteine decarboxylase / phosphopantothenate---cysteine ligase